jgi:hypothetical protein
VTRSVRRVAWAAVGALAAGGVAAAPAAQARPGPPQRSCPAAESLVPGTQWHLHKLAPGVTLAEGATSDSRGRVDMHVLRVDLTQRGVSVEPLRHAIASRSPLTALAAHHSGLVAATNTGYFDFMTGAPTGALISHGQPLVLSKHHEAAVGIGRDGRAEAGKVWLTSSVVVGSQAHRIAGINQVGGHRGLGIYTPAWGGRAVPTSWGTTLRAVRNDLLTAVGGARTVPADGALLVAHTRTAGHWLASRSTTAKLAVVGATRTTAPSPFVQAYGVGVTLVQQPGVPRTGFSCDSANTTQPARTAIGFADGGRELILAMVADHPGTSLHGLDEDQMSKLMVQLGASRAYAFDGSGSTELLARMPGASSLSLRTYPADGVERPMPVGLGITYHKPKHHHHHKHRKH